jgi:hypothetical protein
MMHDRTRTSASASVSVSELDARMEEWAQRLQRQWREEAAVSEWGSEGVSERLQRLEGTLATVVHNMEQCLGVDLGVSDRVSDRVSERVSERVVAPEFQMSTRLSNMEKLLQRFNQDLQVVERRVETTQRYSQLGKTSECVSECVRECGRQKHVMASSLKSESNLMSRSNGHVRLLTV